MIRLFRKIRKELLSEDKYPIYLLYASGEILLVVIGILIALQLDNWNNKRIQEAEGEELASRLYEELLVIRDYNSGVLEEFMFQYDIVRSILERGTSLDIDSVISATENHWAVQTFSLATYIFSFTEFYDPDFKLYKSSVTDGSIRLVKDETYTTALEDAYTTGKSRIDRLYEREITVNNGIETHIAANYSGIFSSQSNVIEGNWDSNTVRAILQAILDDGAFRFLLQKKSSILKSKISILENGIMFSVDEAINIYFQ